MSAAKYKFKGKLRTVREIAAMLDVHVVTIYTRIRNAKGKITDELLLKPSSRKRKFQFRGKMRYIPEIAKIIGVNCGTLYKRLESSGGVVTDKTFLPSREYIKFRADRLKSESGSFLTDIAFDRNLSYATVQERFYRGHRNDAVLGAITPNYDKEYGIIETSENKEKTA